MSAPAPPTIPPRPVKQQAAAQGVSKLPDIPPRPVPKHLDRSVSPSNFPQSPLNEPYTITKRQTPDPVPRAPSVHHLPTRGEEGLEYANIQYTSNVPASAPGQDADGQTRTVAEDLHLHAPKPSLPTASASAQVQGVTRTDSAQAVSHGVGKASVDDLNLTRTRSRQSFSRPDSAASGDRRRSVIYNEEEGPAVLGLRVPINPLLGDVQAPTPQGMSPQVTGDSPRRHSRRKSGVEDFRPPDSYGLHGHGVVANTKFEREWYNKHPDQLEHEEGQGHGVYEGIGSGRGSFALSSDELNKLVRGTASRGAGFGTNPDIVSYPDEQIGYKASEIYQRSQQNTPHNEPLSRVQTHETRPANESPLRRTSFPVEPAQTSEAHESQSSLGSDRTAGDDHNGTHHIGLPDRRFNKVTGGQESTNETQEARPYASHAQDDGSEYRVPILAEDEVAKEVGADHLHPAVSPKFDRYGTQQQEDHQGSGAITPTSRPASRPGSIYQMHSANHSLSRFLSHQDEREHMHTPLEDVAEYEPLFDEDEEVRKMTTAERFKRRPDMLQKRFPSQDIWEDTPSSAMYVAEVSTPDLPTQGAPSQGEKQLGASSTFETPEAEHARKGEVSEEEKKKLIPKEERLAKSRFAPHLRDDMPTNSRPSMAQRFPSQDIWEDTPDSNYLTTTVGSPQIEEDSIPVESKPQIPQRPAKSRLGEDASPAQIEPSVAPNIPARPPKRTHAVPPVDAKLTEPIPLSKETSPTEVKKTPSLPDRPKPQIPPRPGKKPADDELTKVTSAGSNDGAETERSIKAKPQVPARPAVGGIASLKGNFMSDLNKKLGLGPPKEKEPEPEVEAKPLEDARKSRARGPQRRAPAKSPAGEPKKATSQFTMFSARSMWQINDHDELSTIHEAKEEPEPVSTTGHVTTHDTPDDDEKMPGEFPDDASEPPSNILSTNKASEHIDPVATGRDEETEAGLTHKTTASAVSGQREEPNADVHMLSVSQQTTASDSVEEQLEQVATKGFEAKAEDEPIQVRNEQVNAPSPGTNTHAVAGQHSSLNQHYASNTSEQSSSESANGNDEAKEPMNEKDVDYHTLEEMTAKADGKTNAEDDPEAAFLSRKVMD